MAQAYWAHVGDWACALWGIGVMVCRRIDVLV